MQRCGGRHHAGRDSVTVRLGVPLLGVVTLFFASQLPGTRYLVHAAANPPAAERGAPYLRPYKPLSRRDFTGIWEHTGSFGWRQDAPLGAAQAPPFTPPYQTHWEQYLADDAAGRQYMDPVAGCLPPGVPRMMSMPYPMEILQNARQVNVFSEWMEQIRRIFTDGRPLPENPDPTYNGYSVGHFEGDALIVETIGLRGDTLIDVGMQHSAAMRVRERFWLADDNTLKDEITLLDTQAFVHPWVTTKTFRRAEPSLAIMPWVCLENNRNPIDDQGHVGFTLKTTPAPDAPPVRDPR